MCAYLSRANSHIVFPNLHMPKTKLSTLLQITQCGAQHHSSQQEARLPSLTTHRLRLLPGNQQPLMARQQMQGPQLSSPQQVSVSWNCCLGRCSCLANAAQLRIKNTAAYLHMSFQGMLQEIHRRCQMLSGATEDFDRWSAAWKQLGSLPRRRCGAGSWLRGRTQGCL